MPLAALLLALVLGLAQAGTAFASCAPPEPVAQRAARADAIVHGEVVGFTDGARRLATVRVDRVLKGTVTARIVVGLGPEVSGGGGATSVDYLVEAGTTHTFYLRREGATGYRTDACSGSHGGAPLAEEVVVLGTGTAPEPAAGAPATTTDLDRGLALAVLAGALAVTFIAFRGALARAR